MADEKPYETRFFNSRTGDVALTCCTRCGAIVWNPTLHERNYHADEDSTDEEDSSEATSIENGDGATQLATTISRPPITTGTGQAIRAGSGKQSRR